MVAQDTGSAIVGPARADIYFGAGADAGKVSGRLRHNVRFVILVPKSLDPVARGHAMPLPSARPSQKIAKLFPQIDPLKNQQKDQKDGGQASEPASAASSANNVSEAKDVAKTPVSPLAVAQAAAAQTPVANTVPLPEARPNIKPSRHGRRTHYYRRYRGAR
jgi:membrane-bound lytic murein transglycosylase A